jgi:hypothetical protein
MPIPLARPPQHALYLRLCGRGLLSSGEARASPPNKLTILYRRPVASRRVAAPFHQREQPRVTLMFENIIVDVSLLRWHLVAIARGCRPCAIIFLSKNQRDASRRTGLYSLAQPTLSSSHITHTLHINMASMPSEGSADRGAEERLLYAYVIFILFVIFLFSSLPPPSFVPSPLSLFYSLVDDSV